VTQGLEGREPSVGQRDEHQDSGLWLLQRVCARQQVGHFLRESPLCGSRTFPRYGTFIIFLFASISVAIVYPGSKFFQSRIQGQKDSRSS